MVGYSFSLELIRKSSISKYLKLSPFKAFDQAGCLSHAKPFASSKLAIGSEVVSA
jgi:hypothetical protein